MERRFKETRKTIQVMTNLYRRGRSLKWMPPLLFETIDLLLLSPSLRYPVRIGDLLVWVLSSEGSVRSIEST